MCSDAPITRAPCRKNASVTEVPSPPLAPVMKTTLFCMDGDPSRERLPFHVLDDSANWQALLKTTAFPCPQNSCNLWAHPHSHLRTEGSPARTHAGNARTGKGTDRPRYRRRNRTFPRADSPLRTNGVSLCPRHVAQ